MPKATLTAAFCAAAQCPPGRKRCDFWDAQTQGFVLSVRASGGKTYVLRFIQNGRQREYKIAGHADVTFDAARKAARKLRAQVVMGADPSAEREQKRAVETYAALAELHIAHAEANQKAAFSAVGIIRKHLIPRFGRMRLDEITSKAVSDWLAEKRAEGLKPATLEKYRVTLGRSFSLGQQWRVPGCESNQARDVRLPRFDNRRQRFLSGEEAGRLLDAAGRSANPMLRPIVHLLVLTGARVSELRHARWEHLDLDRRSWLIPISKNGNARYVPLSQAALDVISGLPRYDGCPHMVANPETRLPYVTLKHSWASARKAAGLGDLRLHDLRHSAASFMVAAGIDLYAVGKILGHTDYKSTQRYAHLANDTLLAAVEAGAAKMASL